MAGQEQPPRGQAVQGGDDVGEGDLATGGRRPEGVQVHVPAGGQRGQSGGDVLKQSGDGALKTSEENASKGRRKL